MRKLRSENVTGHVHLGTRTSHWNERCTGAQKNCRRAFVLRHGSTRRRFMACLDLVTIAGMQWSLSGKSAYSDGTARPRCNFFSSRFRFGTCRHGGRQTIWQMDQTECLCDRRHATSTLSKALDLAAALESLAQSKASFYMIGNCLLEVRCKAPNSSISGRTAAT